MIINWESGDELRLARIFDADGNEYHRVCWIDTETGACKRLLSDDGVGCIYARLNTPIRIIFGEEKSYVGWTIIKDCNDGSFVIKSPQGHVRRIMNETNPNM